MVIVLADTVIACVMETVVPLGASMYFGRNGGMREVICVMDDLAIVVPDLACSGVARPVLFSKTFIEYVIPRDDEWIVVGLVRVLYE
jgi:hypothetical protein